MSAFASVREEAARRWNNAVNHASVAHSSAKEAFSLSRPLTEHATDFIELYNRGPARMSDERKGSVAQTVILVLALLLLVVSFAFSAAGLLSPSWQVVDIREFRAEHHHGLWQDCTRPERLVATSQFTDTQPLHCTYKFDVSASQVIDENIDDIDQNSAAGESEHHQFFGWHKACLVFMILSLLLVALALCCGLCAPCNGACAVVFTIQQTIGYAFYMHIAGTTLLMFALIVSIIATYQMLRKSEDGNGGGFPIRELAPLYGSRIRETRA